MSRQPVQGPAVHAPMPPFVGDLFQSLRNAAVESPDPGFSERVMQRIQRAPPASIWSFTQTKSASDQVLAFAALTLLFATLAVCQESTDFGQAVVDTGPADRIFPVTGSLTEQRDAVLLNIAAYSGLPKDK
jgi:hypothetical protein